MKFLCALILGVAAFLPGEVLATDRREEVVVERFVDHNGRVVERVRQRNRGRNRQRVVIRERVVRRGGRRVLVRERVVVDDFGREVRRQPLIQFNF